MTTIAYDLPMLDLIDELDATKHVSHVQHRKSKVTLHHNGGRLSHYGVLQVWQVRPASAHFNVDGPGTCAQFVRVNEYAWATGSTEGNQDSISIEMCNESLSPDWVVGESTWRAAGRLAGWLLARVIGERPSRDNLVVHKYWSATSCAGPHIDKVYNQILAVAQQTFDAIVHGIVTEKGKHMVCVLHGDAPGVEGDKHYLVEVTGDGAKKRWLKTGELSTVFQTLLGTPAREVPQWTLDYIATDDPIG